MKLYLNMLDKRGIDRLKKEFVNTTKEIVSYEMLYSDEGIFESRNKKVYKWIIEMDGKVSDINIDENTMLLDETIMKKIETKRIPYKYSSYIVNEEVYKINDKMQLKIIDNSVAYFESEHQNVFIKKMLVTEASKYLRRVI